MNTQKQKGLTLVELMVAMTISLFLLIAIALVYQSSKNGFAYSNNTVRMSPQIEPLLLDDALKVVLTLFFNIEILLLILLLIQLLHCTTELPQK